MPSAKRCGSVGFDAKHSSVNQLPTTVSASTPVPSARTFAALSSHASDSPNFGAVEISVRVAMRSGFSSAIVCATAPPSDRPTRCARSTPRESMSARTSPAKSDIW